MRIMYGFLVVMSIECMKSMGWRGDDEVGSQFWQETHERTIGLLSLGLTMYGPMAQSLRPTDKGLEAFIVGFKRRGTHSKLIKGGKQWGRHRISSFLDNLDDIQVIHPSLHSSVSQMPVFVAFRRHGSSTD